MVSDLELLKQRLVDSKKYLDYIQSEYETFDRIRREHWNALIDAKLRCDPEEEIQNLEIRLKVFISVSENLSLQLNWLLECHSTLENQLRILEAN
jgi:hypothetical protein